MHKFQKSKTIPYPALLIKNVIMDIEKYPEFLPWCSQAIILEQNHDFIIAQLNIKFQNFEESYISKTTIEETSDSTIKIETRSISGPFQNLLSIWELKSLDKLTKVNFSIDFCFKSQILNVVIGTIFHAASKKMIASFENRVKKLHNVTFPPTG
ncbi:MAG TPA: type II toxin-antitoxin system RatA family toxin [Candidatus Megaira endosymbiont of Nemacystus decipiens]|nr:type II toxin-antitoxin system RatA family toxin [Candidatus Megaera endosymbiont of Nemacystus decipiens]